MSERPSVEHDTSAVQMERQPRKVVISQEEPEGVNAQLTRPAK